ncbi:uncharacterized protein LOC127440130 [Myxocyprinus asiaticus]|uniref:uncharacterized protein LOC127440130 n=1 Tax=Myxocyprinus asiaticus TaxID=70543 RepID=UPI0022218469|nr:uncharacterized protein LOC127440130 [Myxocyprinus asiaticus]
MELIGVFMELFRQELPLLKYSTKFCQLAATTTISDMYLKSIYGMGLNYHRTTALPEAENLSLADYILATLNIHHPSLSSITTVTPLPSCSTPSMAPCSMPSTAHPSKSATVNEPAPMPATVNEPVPVASTVPVPVPVALTDPEPAIAKLIDLDLLPALVPTQTTLYPLLVPASLMDTLVPSSTLALPPPLAPLKTPPPPGQPVPPKSPARPSTPENSQARGSVDHPTLPWPSDPS